MDKKHRTNVFLVCCPSQERRRQAEQIVRDGIDLGTDFVRTTRAFPNGVEKQTTTHHRLRDYFSDIRIEGQPGDAETFRIVFDPRDDADRYWKDVMVQILKTISSSAEGVSVKACKAKT